MPITSADLNSKLNNLVNSFDLKASVSKLDNIAIKDKAADLTEMGKFLGDVKGGFASLSQNIDNAAELAAGQLNANGYPSGGVNTATINRIDESIQASVPALQTALSTQAAAISSLVSSSHGSSAALVSGSAPAALPITGAAAGLMNDIIADGSPEAIAGTLKSVADVMPTDIKGLLQDVANIDVKDIVDLATSDILGFNLSNPFDEVLDAASGMLDKVLGGLDGGNLLKAAVENFTGDIQNAVTGVIGDLGVTGPLKNLKSYTNSVIAGKGFEVANELVKSVKVPGRLGKELSSIGELPGTFQSLGDLGGFVDRAKNLGLSTQGLAEVGQLEGTLNTLDTEIANRDTSISASVIPGSGVSSNPVVDPSTYSTGTEQFPFLSSEEEIVRYLQSASREITTVVWHWTAHYTNQGYIGSEQINASHVNGRGWSAIGYHFVVKRDGSIQIGRDINQTGAHVGGFNARSIGISFVAGYKCSSDKYRGIPPHSEVGPESITQAQHQSFKKFMSAWYKVYPGGNAWGHVDFPNNKGKVDPGFDVSKRVYELFGKKNVGHPKKDGAILTAAQISSKRQFGGTGEIPGQVTDASPQTDVTPSARSTSTTTFEDGTTTSTTTNADGTKVTTVTPPNTTVSETTRSGDTVTTTTVTESGGGSTTTTSAPRPEYGPADKEQTILRQGFYRNEASAKKTIQRNGLDPRNYRISTTPSGRAKVYKRV